MYRVLAVRANVLEKSFIPRMSAICRSWRSRSFRRLTPSSQDVYFSPINFFCQILIKTNSQTLDKLIGYIHERMPLDYHVRHTLGSYNFLLIKWPSCHTQVAKKQGVCSTSSRKKEGLCQRFGIKSEGVARQQPKIRGKDFNLDQWKHNASKGKVLS